jgi:hypothetical protein
MQTHQRQHIHLASAQPAMQLMQTKQPQSAGGRLLPCRHSSSSSWRQAQASTRTLWLQLLRRTQHKPRLLLEQQQHKARRSLLC